MTLSTTSYKYSNATGWWQNILNSMGKCIIVDGIFGNQTKNATISFQGDPLWGVTPADGAVNTNDWNAVQFAKPPGSPNYRHQPTGYVDGYGTGYWKYYGGGESALLGWNPWAPQQFFNPYRISQGGQNTNWTLIAATASRTMGSYGCAA
jgi:hypothetical protein